LPEVIVRIDAFWEEIATYGLELHGITGGRLGEEGVKAMNKGGLHAITR
jgi:hypothetical protein